MSHANGEVIIDGKTVAYYEYNGTCDYVYTTMRNTRQEVQDHWRNGEWSYCVCGDPSVPVILYTDYGYGFHWSGKACFKCMAITDGIEPDGSEDGRT